jgi:hypothetical protein
MLHQYDWLFRPKCICDWLSVVKVHVDELSSTRIWQHKLCVTLSASVDIKYRLPIKIYYRICTFILIRVEIIHGSFHDIFMSPKRRHIVFAPFLIILIIILLPLSYSDLFFFGLSRSTRCGCCSLQVSPISDYDHFCVFQFSNILAVSKSSLHIYI